MLKPYVIALAVLLSGGHAACAVELPIAGTYGTDDDDCRAAKEENEGGYVAFEKSSIGHGGQGGCDISSVRKTGENAYALVGLCYGLEGPKKRQTLKLVVKSPDAIVYDGTDYKRCPR